MTLSLLVIPLVMQPSSLLAFFATAAHCSLTLRWLSTRTPRFLSTEVLTSQVDLSLCYTPGSWFPTCKTLHLSFLNFIRFLLAHSSSLSRSSCRVALPYKVSTSALSLISLENFIRVHLVPSSRSLLKLLNSVRPSINPWETPFEKELFTTTLWVQSVSSSHTGRTTCPDHNTSFSLEGGCGKLYWKPWRNLGRQCLPLTPHQPSRVLCRRRQSGLSSTICPWWIRAGRA